MGIITYVIIFLIRPKFVGWIKQRETQHYEFKLNWLNKKTKSYTKKQPHAIPTNKYKRRNLFFMIASGILPKANNLWAL